MTVIIIAIVALVAVIGLGFVKKVEVKPIDVVELEPEGVIPIDVVEPKNKEILDPQPGMVDVTKPIDGFTLGLENIPKGTTKWNANFAEESFSYKPMADSGWLSIGQIWVYPGNPRDIMTLRIWMLDAENNIMLDEGNLGPVRNRTDYVFDCGTRVLKVRTGGTIE